MKQSETIKELSAAFNKFQTDVTNPKNTETNEFFNSKYASLDKIINCVKPILTKNGLGIIQNVSGDGEKISVSTRITHTSGEWIESDVLTLNNAVVKGVSVSQSAGISITYARRYQLSAMLGISSEDDTDGNDLVQHKPQTQNKEKALSEPQVKRLFALGSKAGYDMAQIKGDILRKYKVNVEQLSKADYDHICESFERLIKSKETKA